MNLKTLNQAQVENKRGEWVPSIPLPYYELKKRCDCGRRFWTMAEAKKDAKLDHNMPEYRGRTYVVEGVVFSDGEFS